MPSPSGRLYEPEASTRFPEKIPKPKIELLTLSLKIADPEKPNPFNKIFGVEEELKAHGLDVSIPKINFHTINIDQIDSFFFRCPKLPSDTEARIGVRRNPQNPDKIEKVFGYNAILTTSIELSLGLELLSELEARGLSHHRGKCRRRKSVHSP